jgi:hypothetical protein
VRDGWADGEERATAKEEADSSATLRNDKQKALRNDKQVHATAKTSNGKGQYRDSALRPRSGQDDGQEENHRAGGLLHLS